MSECKWCGKELVDVDECYQCEDLRERISKTPMLALEMLEAMGMIRQVTTYEIGRKGEASA